MSPENLPPIDFQRERSAHAQLMWAHGYMGSLQEAPSPDGRYRYYAHLNMTDSRRPWPPMLLKTALGEHDADISTPREDASWSIVCIDRRSPTEIMMLPVTELFLKPGEEMKVVQTLLPALDEHWGSDIWKRQREDIELQVKLNRVHPTEEHYAMLAGAVEALMAPASDAYKFRGRFLRGEE